MEQNKSQTKRPYHKSLRSQKRRGVSLGDKRWNELFDFLDERKFTMNDMLACVCGVMIKYKQGYYETSIDFADKGFDVKITNSWRIR